MTRPVFLACLLIGPFSAGFTPLAGGDFSQADLDIFESKIRPVLVKHCYQCHSAKAASEGKLKAKLLLDTRQSSLAGGESGAAIVPGKPEKSLLLSAMRHDGFEMPPSGKLPDPIIDDFVNWIRIGAPDPREGRSLAATRIDIQAGRDHWSFQPIGAIQVPTVSDGEWVRTPVDRFIRQRQEDAGVVPNRIAQPRTLVRRVYYDLIGLPPRPEDVDRFVAEAEQDFNGAYERLVDRLLDSDQHGERWARHWLDLVRFAESNGYAFDKDRPNAYHYRDFVIRAFNSDMPYDQFVRLQIAGDLLANSTPRSKHEAADAVNAIAATGFLVAGPFTTQQTQKERERSRYEQLDDMIHTLGTSMLGLTVGCARCHDHKYDPLPQHDYYRFASAFADVGFSNTGVNRSPQEYQQAKVNYDRALSPLVQKLAEFESQELPKRLQAWIKRRPATQPAPSLDAWHHIGPFVTNSFDKAFSEAYPPEQQIDLAKSYGGGKLKWTKQPDWKDGIVHNTLTGNNSANYLFRVIDSPAAGNIALSLGSDDAIKVWINGGEVLQHKIGRGVAADQEKVTIPLKKGRNQLLMKIVNGGGPSGFYFKSSLDGAPAAIARLLTVPLDDWNDKQKQEVLDWYKKQDQAWIDLNTAIQNHKKAEPKAKLTSIYAAKVRGSSYSFGGNSYKVYHLRRGNADNKQQQAKPGFLQVLMTHGHSERNWIDAAANGSQADKPARMALADWLTDARHGAGQLLARVIVNRLWHQHFGRGIVATPDDFGARGERPSHPQLLDWLASELIRGGWKLKPIHKLLLTSAVYMQANHESKTGLGSDPENLLWWRRDSRRLEAEIIRDALLEVSGSLDPKMYGKGTLDENSTRRSIYLTVKRSRLLPMLQLFDAPDAIQSVGDRQESTVAPQALALLNAASIRNLATKLAQRIRPNDKVKMAEAIANAYRLAFSRSPDEDEQLLMQGFVLRQTKARGGTSNAETLALRDFCHLLLCTNEFVYVD